MEARRMNGAAIQMYCKITEMISMPEDYIALDLWLLPLNYALVIFCKVSKNLS